MHADHALPAGATIRAARPGDESLLLQFIRELADYEKMSEQVVATSESLRVWLFGAQRAAEALICECEGLPAGFALYFLNFSTFVGKPGIYLEDLFVRPAMRGRGLGRALLAELARIAVERGYARMDWTVLDWNEPSIRFYQSLGARHMAEWQIYRLSGEPLRRLARGEVHSDRGA